MERSFGPLPMGGLCPVARCALRGGEGYPQLAGSVRFYPYGRGTLVCLEVSGLPHDGFFGFHIHEAGDCSDGGDVAFYGAGGHFDPTGEATHPDHAGDLPSVLSCGGEALLMCYTGRFRPHEVLGRSAVLHLEADDYRTAPSGNTGARIACGVIHSVSQSRC